MPDGPLHFARNSCWIIHRNRPGTWKRTEACGWEVWILTGRQKNCRSLHTSWPGATNQKCTSVIPKGSSPEWRSQVGGKPPWTRWQLKCSIHPVFICPSRQRWGTDNCAQHRSCFGSLCVTQCFGHQFGYQLLAWLWSLICSWVLNPNLDHDSWLPVNTREERKFEMEARFHPNSELSCEITTFLTVCIKRRRSGQTLFYEEETESEEMHHNSCLKEHH